MNTFTAHTLDGIEGIRMRKARIKNLKKTELDKHQVKKHK